MPSPDALRAFEEVHPGAAAAILAEFKNEAEHRRTQENREALLRIRETHFGQFSALVFGLAALAVAAFAAYEKASWIGSIVGGGVIVSGIIAFINGRPKNDAD